MKNSRVTLIGIGLILMAVLIILCCILIPRVQAKQKLGDVVEALCDVQAQYVIYTDPHYQNEGLLAQNGREVRLEGEVLTAVRAQLCDLEVNCRYRGKAKENAVSIDKRLLVKGALGESVQLFLGKEQLYFSLGDSTYLFAPLDSAGYEALLALLDGAL